jgi:hypothetical protein
LFFSFLITHYTSLGIYSFPNKIYKKLFLYINLFINLGLLVLFKYADFLRNIEHDFFNLIGLSNELHPESLGFILPLGISFYTFQAIAYTVDVYRQKLIPEKKFFDLPDADKILESSLSNYCLLNIDQVIQVKLLDEVYKIKIIEIKSLTTDISEELIEITNMDLKVDIDNIFLEEDKIIEQPISTVDELKTDFDKMIIKPDEPEVLPEGLKIGGTQVPIEDVRLARLRYYEKIKNLEI